jgi:hypothetical protein
MTAERILQLIELIRFSPYDPPLIWKEQLQARAHSRAWESDRRVSALTDPEFGWHYVKSLTHLGLPLPLLATEPVLYAAYRYETGIDKYYDDTVIREAMELQSPDLHFYRNVIKAGLIIPEMSYEEISQLGSFSVAGIQAYEQLFWNVRDRASDPGYIPMLVFPQTIVMQRIHGLDLNNTEPGQLLLQIALLLGREGLLHWSGLQRECEARTMDPEQAARELLKENQKFLWEKVQCGLLNQDLPSVKAALRLHLRTRSPTESSPPPAGGMSAGQSIRSTLERIRGGGKSYT